MKTPDITGALPEAKGEQMERPQWGERGRDQAKSVGNTVVREKLLEVMSAEGFLICGMSYNTRVLVCTAILLDCLQPLEKVCSTHWLLIVDAIQKYLTEHRAPFYNWVSLAGGGRGWAGKAAQAERWRNIGRKTSLEETGTWSKQRLGEKGVPWEPILANYRLGTYVRVSNAIPRFKFGQKGSQDSEASKFPDARQGPSS